MPRPRRARHASWPECHGLGSASPLSACLRARAWNNCKRLLVVCMFVCICTYVCMHVLLCVCACMYVCCMPGCAARTIPAAASRAVHSIVVPTASAGAGLSQDSLDVFATCSADGGLAMWDLRSPAVVRTFGGHVGRSYHVGAAFSPCMRYIASGSEDKVCSTCCWGRIS